MKRKLHLKNWVKETILLSLILVLIILLSIILKESNNKFVENCMQNGYSENYCERSK